ncbi:MAG: hypothetical protein AB8F34_05515 [Akkermansiaceae bacterium]
MLSLSTITLRENKQGQAQAEAKANARMALMIALGELQKYAGPDQRVTARADLENENATHKNWIAVWSTVGDKQLPIYMVSGNAQYGIEDLAALSEYPDGYHLPDQPSSNMKKLLYHGAENKIARVYAPAVTLTNTQGEQKGSYAYWISDESSKARINIQAPEATNSDTLRIVRSRTAQENGIAAVNADWSELKPDGNISKDLLLSNSTLGLSVDNNDVPKTYAHDLTSGGYGLPINVVDSGMKVDLSYVMDSTDTTGNRTQDYLGGKAMSASQGGSTYYQFSINDKNKYFLLPELSDNGTRDAGPNWGILYNYAKSYETNKSSGATPLAGAPASYPDLRKIDWSPYKFEDGGSRWEHDLQHQNSSLTPVISHLQLGFYLTAEAAPVPQGMKPTDKFYQLKLGLKPMVGIWNPYNVKISQSQYTFDWAVYPYLRFGIKTPSGLQNASGNSVTYQHPSSTWLREEWLAGSTLTSPDPRSPTSRWFRMFVKDVDLEPGEFRLFSIDEDLVVTKYDNELKPTWGVNGLYSLPLNFGSAANNGPSDGKPMVLHENAQAWIGDIYLEDAQHQDTTTHFGGEFAENSSRSWLSVSGGGGSIHRFPSLWVSGGAVEGEEWTVPEQLKSLWTLSGGTQTSPKYLMSDLAIEPRHMATWAFRLRTSSDATASNVTPNQSTRGFVDSNPRAASANPIWDGSKKEGDNFKGWWFASPLVGGAHEGQHSDFGPNGRGMIAWGEANIPEPEVMGPRYQGFGGLANTSLGQTHVPIFDIPRAPLVSLGQFQHASLSRYQYEPAHPFANSYANVRLPLDQTLQLNYADMNGFTMLDSSYLLNKKIWDKYFFSTIAPEYRAASGSVDDTFPLDEVAFGGMSLPNPRMVVRPHPGDESFAAITSGAAPNRGAEAQAARISIEGAFNVNSTSPIAWKALLASMQDFEFPVISPTTGETSWENTDGIRFPRFGHVLQKEGYSTGGSAEDSNFWQAYRLLTNDELDELATEIVKEVRTRGPFRSLAEFVNRHPDLDNDDFRRKGALQGALDRVVNSKLGDDFGSKVIEPEGFDNDVYDSESPTAGYAGYILQGDVLQSLAPILQPRADYFRIRAVGESSAADGTILAQAVCEAYVQRVGEYIDTVDAPELKHDDLKQEVNRRFGRRYRITSFRWLDAKSI